MIAQGLLNMPENSQSHDFLFKFNLKGVFDSVARYLYNISSYKDINPQRLFVYPSAKCNNRCIYCGEYCKGENRQGIDFFENRDFVDRLISDIKDLKIKEIHLFGGGEPFFYKDNMLYFLRKLRDTDIFIKIITNGVNLDAADIDNIVKNGLVSELAFNLNTDSVELARQIYSHKDKHAHTLGLLEGISEYKRLYNKTYPLIDIFFVLFNMNYNKISDIISILNKFEISFFFIQPLRVYSAQHESLRMSQEETNEFKASLPHIEKILKEANINSNINDFKINEKLIEDSGNLSCVIPDRALSGRSRLACYQPLTTLSIYPDGLIHKCMYLEKAYNGNYFSFSSLREFISSTEYVDFTKQFIGNGDLDMCKNCHACVLNEVEEIKKSFVRLSAANPSKINL